MDARITLGLGLLLALPHPLSAAGPIAEVVCAPRAQMVARLQQAMGADLAATGMRSAEALIEVWADAQGDWTLVQTHANGQSCIVAMGEAWEALAPPPA